MKKTFEKKSLDFFWFLVGDLNISDNFLEIFLQEFAFLVEFSEILHK